MAWVNCGTVEELTFQPAATADEVKRRYRKQASNPEDPACQQLVSTLVSWKQVCDRICRPAPPSTPDAVLNTLRYLFFHCKCGIFVRIHQGRVTQFYPFVNVEYVNTWSGAATYSLGSTAQLHAAVKRVRIDAREVVTLPPHRHWTNGRLVCNIEAPDHWGDAYLGHLRHIMDTACATAWPDVAALPPGEACAVVFLNKRDGPVLPRPAPADGRPLDPVTMRPLLQREAYRRHAPVFSFFTAPDTYADVPMVTQDDWEHATRLVYPPACADTRSAQKWVVPDVPWAAKRPTALFRGSATGEGVTPDTNVRLRLVTLAAQWVASTRHCGGDAGPLLDAQLTSGSTRDRITTSLRVQCMDPATHPVVAARGQPIPMHLQSAYKYIVYAPGHSAAARLSTLLLLNVVVLYVQGGTSAPTLWLTKYLRPATVAADASGAAGGVCITGWDAADHIPVSEDCHDLADIILWCRAHDAECRQIAANAVARGRQLTTLATQAGYMAHQLKRAAAWYARAAEMDHPGLAVTDAGSFNVFSMSNPRYAAVSLTGTSADAKGSASKPSQPVVRTHP